MEDALKSMSLGRVGEYYRSKFGPVQVAGGRKDARSEYTSNLFLHLWSIDERVCGLIGVKKLPTRQKLTNTVAKRCLACSDSPGDSDCRHELNVNAARPTVSAAKSQQLSRQPAKAGG
jgi:hypothetical protein